MTNQQHPITPTPELVAQWINAATGSNYEAYIAAIAAQWGADQELKACCEWLKVQETQSAKWFDIRHDACALVSDLCAARRPKPPSLKEQALGAIGRFTVNAHINADEMNRDFDTIRRALEALPE
jgi:hypothetical protein